MESYEYKIGETIYNFEEMIVYYHNGWRKLSFNKLEQRLYRMTDKGYQRLSPKVEQAYLNYEIEKIMLGGE